jgi:hypothetical protein
MDCIMLLTSSTHMVFLCNNLVYMLCLGARAVIKAFSGNVVIF